MASKAQSQTVKAEFLDPSLYEDAGLSGLPRLSRGTLLAALAAHSIWPKGVARAMPSA